MSSAMQDDPITSDPSSVDWEYPPTIATVTPASHGDTMNGIIYVSNGKGPHPAVLMLHGYPGDEKNLDLAQAIRRAGWNVCFFHYRGAWGSAGTFSVDHALEDISAVLDFLRLPQSQHDYRIDASRIVVLGHSMGAYLALLAGARLDGIERIVVMAPVNLGPVISDNPPQVRATIADSLEAMGHGAIKSAGAEQFVQMGSNPDRYDFLEQVAWLDGKSVLIIAAARDEDTPPVYHCEPLRKLLIERGKSNVTYVTLDTDHVFSTARITLARTVISWLQGNNPSNHLTAG